MSKTFYITTPIYYANAEPHIGHAYTTIACDALARFKRLDGYQVKFLTGTDEHGQKIAKAAEAKEISPIDLCNQNSQMFRDLAKALNASNDDFIRTTEDRHVKACQDLWKKLEANGQIYLDKYAGWYAVRDEAYYDESELIKGPKGEQLAPTSAPVEWVEEESYFFKLSAWQKPLLDYYASHPDFIGPQSRLNEVASFVAGGKRDNPVEGALRDISISRTAFSWGIPVPGNDKHVMYVWIDALTNYITALGYPDFSGEYATFWPEAFHVIGKEIIRFHCVYWPAFLLAAGLKPPKRIFAHGWWTVEGQKMSKSLGNVVDPHEMIAKYGLDPFRYFLLREVPFGNDGDFSEQALVNRANGELSNELGNLAQRGLAMIAKNLGGELPKPGPFTAEDSEMMTAAGAPLLNACRTQIETIAPHGVIEEIWKVVRAANGYVDKQAPWNLRKTDPARMNTVLYVMAETVRNLAILMQPFVPGSAAKMLDQLAVPADQRTFAHLGADFALKGGTALPAPSPVFPRYQPPGTPAKPGKGA
ncbi:MAG: methionine--tRNA ligase [Rhodobacteraceae bacterium]|nr:methionine--tRNA ligase [Paracoccaceae bacterium]